MATQTAFTDDSINYPTLRDIIAEAREQRGEQGVIRMIRANALNVDHSYQRPLSDRLVSQIAGDFDPDLFGIVTVARRDDGTYWVLDGQHRVAAIRLMGRGESLIPCEVLTGLSNEREARVFHLRNARKKPMSPSDKFRGALIAGEGWAVRIDQVVRECGFRVNLSTGFIDNGQIAAVAALEYVDRQYRDGQLADTLMTIRAIWGTDEGPRAGLIRGMAYFLHLYRGQYKHDRLVTRMRTVSLDQLYRDAKEYRTATGADSDVAFAELIVQTYNRRLNKANKLPSVEFMRSLNAIRDRQNSAS